VEIAVLGNAGRFAGMTAPPNVPQPAFVAMPESSSPLHVLYVSPVGELGGAEQVLLTYCRTLPRYAGKASLALLRPGSLAERARSQGIDVHVFPKEFRYRDIATVWQSIGWLAEVIKQTGANLVHANHTAHITAGPASKRAGVPEIWHQYDYPHQKDVMDTINQRIASDYVLFMTEFTQSGYPRLHSRPHSVIYPTCVDVKVLQSMERDPTVRERLGVGSAPFFVTVARLQEHKGHTYLLNAAAKVVTRHPEVKWVLVGRASGAEQEAYLKRLQEQVRALSLEQNVLFAGFVSDNDLAALQSEALALVHPATTEGYGLVLIEAMARQTCVIASAASGPKEIIRDNDNGLLVPTADPEGLAHAMIRVLEEPGLSERLRAGGNRFVQTHSADQMTEKTLDVYRQVRQAYKNR
jgi:glycosyltransferase involved in cell wall biosynthesis